MKRLSLVDGDTIRNNILNTSPTKQGHAFSKTERFRVPAPYCPNVCYQHQGQLSRRGAGFGYGSRSDFTEDLTASPAATKYNPEVQVYSTRRAEKGKTFGLSRDMSPENGTIVKGIQKNPGVGTYDAKGETASNIKYTMRSRTLDVFHKHNSSRATPGPAAYSHRDQFPLNRFSSGKYENPTLGVMNKTARFATVKDSPGPLSYLAPDNLSDGGKYIVSKHAGEGQRRFSMSARTNFTDNFARNKSSNPGPGQYQKHSEFGVYGDTKYYKTLSGFGKFKDLKDISKANQTH